MSQFTRQANVRSVLTRTLLGVLVLALSALTPWSVALAQSYPPPALYGSDALGRPLPGPSEVREFRPDRYVGLFYFLWLRTPRVYDVSQILSEHPAARTTTASPPWGPPHAYHFWGQPLFGYYRSEDPWVLRRHAALLSDAGIDFLVFDATNAVIYEDVVQQLCQVYQQQQKLGEHVPQITFMVNTRAGRTAQRIFDTFYRPGLHPELWFRWKGKPLLICDPAEASPELADFFTLRQAHWPFQLVDTHNAWHWEATYPQVYSYDTNSGEPEQVSVSVGQNLHQVTGRVEMMSSGRARGRSFHEGRVDDRPSAWQWGLNFQEQWQRALSLDPEVTFITGWNEWIAMQLNTQPGRPVFCDQFNLEYSRDVEMMQGGYGDNYYLQMAANIRRFKGLPPPPAAAPGKTIRLADSWDQWEDISPTWRDQALDTLPRDFPGCGDHHYRVGTGRNDFRLLKVTHDATHVYFYARTREDLTPHTDPNWLWLWIGVPGRPGPQWEGFNFLANRQVASATATSLEVCTGGWHWEPRGSLAYRAEGNQVHVAVPRDLLGVQDPGFTLEFKWVDNTQQPGEILDVYVNGDAAPNGRFRYRYQAR